MANFTAWLGTIPSGTTTTNTGSRNDGLYFTVTQDGCTLTGIAFYVIAGETDLTGSDYTATLYSTTTGTSGTQIAQANGSGTFTAGAWNWIPFNQPLSQGVNYVAAIHHPTNLQFKSSYWSGAPSFDNGPLHIPSQASSPGNKQQPNLTGATAFPSNANSPATWYGVDVQVTTLPPSQQPQQRPPRTRLLQRQVPTIPAASGGDVSVSGLTAAVSVAGPTGTESVSTTAPAASVSVAAPAASASVTTPGQVAGVSVAALAGVTSVATTAPAAGVSVTGLAGTESITLNGLSAAVVVGAPVGSVSGAAGVTGVTATVAVAAPAGMASSAIAGPASSVGVAALAGTARVTVSGLPGQVAVAAPTGRAQGTATGPPPSMFLSYFP